MSRQRLLDREREVIRIKHYSIRTEQAYLRWIRRYMNFAARSIRSSWVPRLCTIERNGRDVDRVRLGFRLVCQGGSAAAAECPHRR